MLTPFIIRLGKGNNEVFAGNGKNVIHVGNGDNYIEVGDGGKLFGGEGNDSLLFAARSGDVQNLRELQNWLG